MGLFSATPSRLTGTTEITHYINGNSIIDVVRAGDPTPRSYEEFPCSSWDLKWGRKFEDETIPIFDVRHRMNLPTVQPMDSLKNAVGGTFIVSLRLLEAIVNGGDTRATYADYTIAMDRLENGQEVERIDPKLYQAYYCSMATCGGADFSDRVHRSMLEVLENKEHIMYPAHQVVSFFRQVMQTESFTLPKGMLRKDFSAGLLMGIIDGCVTPRLYHFDLNSVGVLYKECDTYAVDGQTCEEVSQYLRVFYRRNMSVNEAQLLVRICVNLAAGKVQQQHGPLASVGGRIHGSLLLANLYVPFDYGPVQPMVLLPEQLQLLRDYQPGPRLPPVLLPDELHRLQDY